jgi:hypothetical protein
VRQYRPPDPERDDHWPADWGRNNSSSALIFLGQSRLQAQFLNARLDEAVGVERGGGSVMLHDTVGSAMRDRVAKEQHAGSQDERACQHELAGETQASPPVRCPRAKAG